METESQKPFIFIWLCSALTVCVLIILSVLHIPKNLFPPTENFEIERLNRIDHHGVVVLGTSLVRFGFPYDKEMDKQAALMGVPLQFVRFSVSSGRPDQFVDLLKPILSAKPQWVFIHIGPFVSVVPEVPAPPILPLQQRFFIDTHQFLVATVRHQLPLLHLKNILEETDEGISLQPVATVANDLDAIDYLQNPSLSLPYQQFLLAAKQKGIHVVFLQIKRSSIAREKRNKKSIQAEDRAMHILADQYQIPLWVSPAFPLNCYVDGGHLNAQGRIVFTKWFLQRLKNASMDH